MSRLRVAVLISGRGSNMTALIDATKAASAPAEIAAVISNRPDAAGLVRARNADIPTAIIDHKPYGKDRAAFEEALTSELTARGVEFICLAGFMRLFTPQFVTRWHGRMLNVHPSLLPLFKGLDPHGQALAAGVKLSGATVHFVTPETDAGPILVQGAVPVLAADTPESLAARILTVEHRIYPLALRLVAEGRVRIVGDRCEIDDTRAGDGFLISPEA
ncbi:MAG: phosphoribosylglycinamide formyltransferase [Variibacter sp.]